MSEAARDVEDILDGKLPRPNRVANAAYKQYFVNYMQDHEEDMDMEQMMRMVQYIRSLDEVIVANTVRQAREDAQKQMMTEEEGMGSPTRMRAPGPAQPLQDIIQQNVPNQ
jgi:hypothetical protein